MGECESLAKCPFFNDNMPDKPATTAMYKKQYCLGDNTTCARYMIAKKLGKEKVPSDLYPNDKERALQILAAG